MKKFNEAIFDEKATQILESIFPSKIENEYVYLEELLEKWNKLIRRFNSLNANNSGVKVEKIADIQEKIKNVRSTEENENKVLELQRQEIENSITALKSKTNELTFHNMDNLLNEIKQMCALLEAKNYDYKNQENAYEIAFQKRDSLQGQLDRKETDFLNNENEMTQIISNLQELAIEINEQVENINSMKNENGISRIDGIEIQDYHCEQLKAVLNVSEDLDGKNGINKIDEDIKKSAIIQFINLLKTALQYKKATLKQLPLIATENVNRFNSAPETLYEADLKLFTSPIEDYLKNKINMISDLKNYPQNEQGIIFQDISRMMAVQNHILLSASNVLNGVNIEQNMQTLEQKRELMREVEHQSKITSYSDEEDFINSTTRRGKQLLKSSLYNEEILQETQPKI